MWFCCLLTSGYVGILGGIVVVALGLSALRHLRAQLRPVLAAAAVALPLGLLYTVGFVTGADAGARFHTDAPVLGMAADAGLGATASQLQAGSSGLLQLIGVRLADDVARHGIAPVLSLTMLVLAGLAGQVLPKKGTWRLFSAIGLAGLLLSLGPVIETIEGPMSGLPWLERWVMGAPGSPGTGGPPWPGYPNLPWLLFPLAYVPGDVFFHFPYRFAWLTVLGLGGVAAAVATQLAQDLGPRRFLAHGLLLAGLVDATLRPMLPQRSAQVPIGVPSAYASVVGWPGGLLELWPRPAGGATDADLLMNNLSCTYQRVHHLPMVSDCIGTGLDRSPRVRLSRVVFARVVEQRPEGLQAELAALGVGAVAVHPLLFSPEDRERLVGLLDGALGPPVAQSEDAGDPVWIYRVQGAQADRAQARLAWDRLKEG
jgi:hypothetical protein